MGVIHSIATIKSKLEDQGMACMILDYAQNHTGITYWVLNICTELILLSLDVIWVNKTYREYVFIKKKPEANTFIVQDED